MASFQTIVYQMILSVLRDAKMTSASPAKINTFIGLESGAATSAGIGTDDELREAIIELVGEEFDLVGEDELAQDLLDAEGEKKKKGKPLEKKAVRYATKGAGILNNPALLVAEGLKFLPHAVAIAFAAKIAPMVFEYLTKPGGDLDLRLKIYLQDEFNAFLSRQTQKDTEMGVRQVIIQSKKGFTAANGVNHYNTQKGIREGGINPERMDRIKMVDHAKGLF